MIKPQAIDHLGLLLRNLKGTYGWKSLLTMPRDDLLLLLERSARSNEDQLAVRVFDPWVRAGLLEQLSKPAKERKVGLISTSAHVSEPIVVETLELLDKVVSLSRVERNSTSSTTIQPISSRPSWLWPLLISGAIVGVTAVFAMIGQLGRYRQEISRQQELASKQKKELQKELEKVKSQLSEREREMIAQAQRAASAPPVYPFPRSNLPSSEAETPADSEDSQGSVAAKWAGCAERLGSENPGYAPRSWWPVVGPSGSLELVRQFCRSDAFVNRDGNVQVASFADRSDAEVFAHRVTSDSRHPFTFYVGDSTILNSD